MSVTTTPIDYGRALYILTGHVLMQWRDGMYVCTREGKGDSIEFSPFGGVLYCGGVRVGSIYLDDTDTAEYHTPYWARDYLRKCECGHGTVPEIEWHKFPTPLEVIVDATYMFVC